MYENYEKVRNEKGLKDADVSRGTGIARAVLSEWKNGKFTPRIDKIQKIAEFLDVPIDYIVTGDKPNYKYFLDDEVAETAQWLHDHHQTKIMFDATRKATKEDMDLLINIMRRMGLLDE